MAYGGVVVDVGVSTEHRPGGDEGVRQHDAPGRDDGGGRDHRSGMEHLARREAASDEDTGQPLSDCRRRRWL